MCDLLGPPAGLPRRAARYAGLLPAGAATSLEALLRLKCLVLIAVTLKRRSLRWGRLLWKHLQAGAWCIAWCTT